MFELARMLSCQSTTCAKGYEVAAAKVAYDILRIAELAPTDKVKIAIREQKSSRMNSGPSPAACSGTVATAGESWKRSPERAREHCPLLKASYRKENRGMLVIIMVHVSSFFEQGRVAMDEIYAMTCPRRRKTSHPFCLLATACSGRLRVTRSQGEEVCDDRV